MERKIASPGEDASTTVERHVRLPERIRAKLGTPNADYKLQPHAVAQVFVDADEPFLTRRQVQSRVNGEYDKKTVLSRLDLLVELDVLRADVHPGGTIYWLENEASEWPVPPDVEVEPKRDDVTVAELVDRNSIRASTIGIGAVLLSSLLLPFGVVLYHYNIPAKLMAIGYLLGFLLFFVGWGLFALGVFSYVVSHFLTGSLVR